MDDLRKLRNRIDLICKNKVNAFSPTISPAPKASEQNEIESIRQAFGFFYLKGVNEIVVQRKYMGSYCDIYLMRNLDETYFISRNGYKITYIDLDIARQACKDLHSRFDWEGLELVIIQSELMPWSALGKGLIDKEFAGYFNVHQNHCEHLSTSGLYDKINKVKESQAYKTYIEDKKKLSAKLLKEKYPVHIIRQYDSLAGFKVIELEGYKTNLEIYKEQLTHFGSDGDICFKPFNILKKVYSDGREDIVNDNLSYNYVNDDEFLYFNITDEQELNESIEKTYLWFAGLQENKEEGIVIKPRQAFMKDLPPALKIRNNRYLTMIYGIDFQDNYSLYLGRRNIGKKLECSVNDWMLNLEMLKVKYSEIDVENYYFKNLLYDRIMGENIEATLDSRL